MPAATEQGQTPRAHPTLTMQQAIYRVALCPPHHIHQFQCILLLPWPCCSQKTHHCVEHVHLALSRSFSRCSASGARTSSYAISYPTPSASSTPTLPRALDVLLTEHPQTVFLSVLTTALTMSISGMALSSSFSRCSASGARTSSSSAWRAALPFFTVPGVSLTLNL